ncbi:hypothetical protein ACTFQF_00125 [Aliivibrio fischeri]|uniref:Uncharacterized protein n=1 Tax=Aliivibrio fischeri (strain MJ11) TaxID=388396 RepID=B5EW38_ALIFM|nr:hypothetical protein [Aliivibrio fischeri]ACH64719.1 hypothetical protein VFMJ11_B0095 [Aliivibrio fischeri MJ11]MUK37636.1 hypothetical protein [Aliivibrio fischeri]
MKLLQSSKIQVIIFITILTVSPIAYSFFSPIWFVVDVIRDGNWFLKTTREAIFQDERMSNYEDMLEQSRALTEWLDEQKNANQSAEIQAKTTSISITKNNHAEERYSAPFQSKELCKIINESLHKVDTTIAESCIIEEIKEDSTYSIITGAMNNTTPTNLRFHDHISNKSQDSTQDSYDKQFLETFSLELSDASTYLGGYSLLSEDEFNSTNSFVELIFGSNIKTPSADQIALIGLPNGAKELEPLRKSLLYKSFVNDSLADRTLINSKAKDGAFINDGSVESHLKRIESLNEVKMTPEVMRYIALYHSKSLTSSLTKLKKSLRNETLQALKLKDTRN